jgi:hypothetical protein
MKWLKKLFKKQVKEEVIKQPVFMNKSEIIACFQSGQGNCNTCLQVKKCNKLKRQIKKLGGLGF